MIMSKERMDINIVPQPAKLISTTALVEGLSDHADRADESSLLDDIRLGFRAPFCSFSPVFENDDRFSIPIVFPEFENLLGIDDCQYHLVIGCLFCGPLERGIWNTRTLAQISSRDFPS
jgi:hypothetical protein